MNLTTRLLENLQITKGQPKPEPPASLPFIDQVNLVHTALFGWPCDALTPLDDYLACGDIHQVALRMIDSERFRHDSHSKLNLWRHGFAEQIDLLHTALYGWPCDALTPRADYLACADIRQVALRMLDADRFRCSIRDKIGLWPEEKWVMTDYRGLRVWVNLFDGFVSFGVLQGNWENDEVGFMLSCLREGDGVIDAGANVGVFTLQAARAVGGAGRVYAFEPMKKTWQMLERSVLANGFEDRCVLFNEALGEREGGGSFHLSRHATNPGSSYISTADDGERIRIRPIDAIAYARPIRFVKIDVEGFEPHIIRGAARTLAEHAPIILTEFFPRSLRAIGGISGPGYIDMLEKLGYEMTVFSPAGDGATVTSADAHRFDAITEPINLVCRPPA
ncbi:FkbM family methyltransferase [Massilia sp. 9096]|uniref:FkbM family methyltransferase n=1 Tax=Massilia sp. 9096 TaxID=1500894 RepID=UPI000690C9E9|nr:FkbM family methyltransferase [Massilia sp. 9096]